MRPQVEKSRLVFVPNPNSPSGNSWSHAQIEQLVPADGVFVLDEAYGDFCDEPHRGELLQGDAGKQVVITRTLSKSYSLAGIRFGYAVAHPDLISGMRKVKDSYNCNTLSLAAAVSALEDQDWMQVNAERIRATRSRLTTRLGRLGFQVVDSQANFVWATHPSRSHAELFDSLKARRILIRYMKFPDVVGGTDLDGLRITIGTDEEIDACAAALSDIVGA